jgi:hypothetical protein
LARSPLDLEVILNVDWDYNATLRRSDGTEWPVGSELNLIFTFAAGDPVTWPAALAGTDARWSVDKTAVNPVAAARPRRVVLAYVEGADDLLWASGTVTVNR